MKIYYLIRSISVDAENFLQMKDVISFKNVFLAPIGVEIPERGMLFFTGGKERLKEARFLTSKKSIAARN